MANLIKTLKQGSNAIYPRTNTRAIFNDDGDTLDQIIADIRQVPSSTSADSGKFLRVNSSGNPVWENIPSPVGEVY